VIHLRRTSLLVALAGLLAVAGSGDAPAQSKSKAPPKAEAAATTLTFHIYKDAGGKFRWRLKDTSDVSVAIATKGYDTKADCQKMIDAVIAGAAKAKVEEDK
jgi:uncharacterized protein YegP (UPF0339 family)